MRIFCDIDGTLTDNPQKRWGNPRPEMIAKINDLIEKGNKVILWSAGGTCYAKAFAKSHGIKAIACLAKPDIMVDDKKTIRTRGIPIMSPDEFLCKDFNKEGRHV